jgi:hypothetical protein
MIPNFFGETMAVDNDSNLPVPIDGSNSANIGTDIYSSSGVTAHAQVMKVAWGNSLNVTRTDESNPLPVRVYGLTGNLATVTVTGAVRGLGTFTVGNTAGSPVFVTGGVNSFVYGVAGATPVSVTGGVYVLGSVGITGAVNVTGGRFLSHTTDTVQVTGSVARGWVLNNADDNVRVWSHAGGTLIPSAIYSSTGVPIGASGNALNVNVIGAGISATVSIGSNVGVENVIGTVLRVQGTANGTAIPVTISGTQTVEIDNSGTNPLFVDLVPSQIPYSSYPAGAFSNFEKLLLGNKLGSASTFHTAGQWLSFIWDAIGEKNSGSVFGNDGTLQQKLQKLVDGTGIIKTKIANPLNNAGADIKIWNLSLNIIPSNSLADMTDASSGYMYINNSNNDILLTTEKFLLDKLNGLCVNAGICDDTNVTSSSGTITLNPTSISTYDFRNGGYVLPKQTNAFLPIKFNRYLLLNTDGGADTGKLTVIIS